MKCMVKKLIKVIDFMKCDWTKFEENKFLKNRGQKRAKSCCWGFDIVQNHISNEFLFKGICVSLPCLKGLYWMLNSTNQVIIAPRSYLWLISWLLLSKQLLLSLLFVWYGVDIECATCLHWINCFKSGDVIRSNFSVV